MLLLLEEISSIEGVIAALHPEVSSEGATKALQNLKEVFEKNLCLAKVTRTYIAEIFLFKALKQIADSEGKEQQSKDNDTNRGMAAVSRELTYLKGNPLLLLQDNIEPNLLAKAKALNIPES